ncbi:NAD(P)/FAD-dependent oxidoreductase [Stratiformator vulcanicus]|uniref:Bifunctional tRNA (Mnm(5)s(2)U34)-methyltransferase/FAD-dependent cmnm(5)s(2)U34 oxidoreductase n=1 Tax=Stratiformator vulcanicus TaxID=2527980 RepID=A0A517QVI7_9PLAN|nr:FAD-dependent oxidoreductase [Stratiformator vulcanicus]QDT35652.1 bifunctional tRNA (mnm(5)s(2)U34)-methyltransferase/FAD-dependent cmnm(5)s(2)U34 oxidoreductase [Stratiformator vulcanicus]
MRKVDTVIIGQGLAGSLVAWLLLQRNENVVVIDRGDIGSASRVAVGLVTPITGKRLVRSWRFDEFHRRGIAIYRAIERELGQELYSARSAVRLFGSQAERERFDGKAEREFGDLVETIDPAVNESLYHAPFGGFQMKRAGRLDVPGFVEAIGEWLQQQGRLILGEFDLTKDVREDAGRLVIETFGLSANQIVCCRGFSESMSEDFAGLDFNAAKGEVLKIERFPTCDSRTIHSGGWLADVGDGLAVGATYEWDRLDDQVTDAGRVNLELRLQRMLRVPYRVIDQAAGVRPILRWQRPTIGQHQTFSGVYCFNGLGSKGVLQAPYFAEQLVSHLCDGSNIEPEADLASSSVKASTSCD